MEEGAKLAELARIGSVWLRDRDREDERQYGEPDRRRLAPNRSHLEMCSACKLPFLTSETGLQCFYHECCDVDEGDDRFLHRNHVLHCSRWLCMGSADAGRWR